MKFKLLALGDAPIFDTGFGRVLLSLLTRFAPHFAAIDVWGIGYEGWPHYNSVPLDNEKVDFGKYPFRIFPGGKGSWNAPEKMQKLLNLLVKGEYTHVFIIQDTFMLSAYEFARALKQTTDAMNIRTVYYCPVDSQLEKNWVEICQSVDQCVAYTEFGKKEILKHWPKGHVNVLPHGVDTSVFHPLLEGRAKNRQTILPDFINPDKDFVILNVNANQKRKATYHSLQVLANLKAHGDHFKLIMHMADKHPDDRTSLEAMGRQLGLTPGVDWCHHDAYFINGHATTSEQGLNLLYNAANLTLSTSLGEGWGLSITESLAAGCPVAAPDHTSCTEIAKKVSEMGMPNRILTLPLSSNCMVNPIDNSRVRYPIDVARSADLIAGYSRSECCKVRMPLSKEVAAWLNWDRIATEFLFALFNK